MNDILRCDHKDCNQKNIWANLIGVTEIEEGLSGRKMSFDSGVCDKGQEFAKEFPADALRVVREKVQVAVLALGGP